MANSYLSRTPSSAGNRKTWTWSGWIKTATTSGDKGIFTASTDASNRNAINLSNEGYFIFDYEVGGVRNVLSSQNTIYRDVSGWYHLVVAVDTTQATDSNRVKMYVNGSQITLTGVVNNYPSQNADMFVNNTVSHSIGRQDWATSYFDGYMSHVALVDGQQLAPTVFGETDSTSGIWKFKQPSGVTWGTNGFWLKFENSGALGTDSSGNSSTFTVNGNGRQALDTPSNVSATWNPLNYDFANNPSSFTNSNTQVTPTQTTAYNTGVSTLAMPKGNGKFYTEIKYISSGNENGGFGIIDMDYVNKTYYENYNLMSETTATTIGRVIYAKTGAVVTGGGVETGSFGGTWSNGDIIQIACDMENGAIYFGKNGTWQNSGVPTSGASRTGAVNTSAASWWTGTSQWGLWCGKKVSTTDVSFQANFGNGYFGTTAITSAGSNGNGSLFEYDVPSGYYALNTKNINTYG